MFTDVSDYGIGYYLIQDNSEGNQQIVMLGHRTLKEQEKDMSTIERELIALELAATKIIYITNEWEVQAYTDHKPLTQVLRSNLNEYRLARIVYPVKLQNIKRNYLKI